MRRILPALIAAAAVVAPAAPAWAAGAPSSTSALSARHRTIHLACHEVAVDAGRPAIDCSWGAVEGADGYRVIAVTRRRHHGVIGVRRTEATSFTRRNVKPGTYIFQVRALDGGGKVVDRSNRERVRIMRDPAAPTPAN